MKKNGSTVFFLNQSFDYPFLYESFNEKRNGGHQTFLRIKLD